MDINDIIKMRGEFIKMALYYGVDEDTAKDVVQDLYVKLIELENKEGSFERITYKGKLNKVYVFNTIRNIIINKRRYTDRNIRIEKDDVIPEFTIQQTEIKEKLSQMDIFSQQLYDAYMKDNISMRELSKRTNISVTTIFYGVKNIRENLKPIFYE